MKARTFVVTSTLTTAGELVFVGGLDRCFRAYDVRTGRGPLAGARPRTSVQDLPVSYAADGEQYIAVPTGRRGWSHGASPTG